jgi:hypothetical protein
VANRGRVCVADAVACRGNGSLAEYVGPAGQDQRELFAVYAPPPAGHDGTVGQQQLRNAAAGIFHSRGHVHKTGLWHRSVCVWVVDTARQLVLIQQRSEHKDTYPNCWDVSVAGHLTGDDGSLMTAARETEEEIGLKVSALRVLFPTTRAACLATLAR